jgi:hypothetical protein
MVWIGQIGNSVSISSTVSAQDVALAGAQADHARIPHGRIAGHLLRTAPDHQRLPAAGVVQAPLRPRMRAVAMDRALLRMEHDAALLHRVEPALRRAGERGVRVHKGPDPVAPRVERVNRPGKRAGLHAVDVPLRPLPVAPLLAGIHQVLQLRGVADQGLQRGRVIGHDHDLDRGGVRMPPEGEQRVGGLLVVAGGAVHQIEQAPCRRSVHGPVH